MARDRGPAVSSLSPSRRGRERYLYLPRPVINSGAAKLLGGSIRVRPAAPAIKGRKMARNVFIAMPFKDFPDPVLDVIKEAGHLLNTNTSRLDEQPLTGSIISHIRSQITQSDLMVAVVSEENGNVYYEIGLAHCQKKTVVLLTADPSTLKFDLRDHRAIVYDPKNPSRVRDELIRIMEA